MDITRLAHQLGQFTRGDLTSAGVKPGEARNFLRAHAVEVGAKRGPNGKPVSLYRLKDAGPCSGDDV